MPSLDAAAYHERTKHHPHRFARSPGGMDWDTQPAPFRHFTGAPRVELDRPPPGTEPLLDRLGDVPPVPVELPGISQLLFDCLALSAVKRLGPSRWSLRCNPSSGNLHPTEGYLVLPAFPGLTAGVYHYCALDHVLEQRRVLDEDQWSSLGRGLPPGGFLVGFSSIHWRESWKYGERAYRYCQLDLGHAVAQVGYAAGALGWQVRLLEGVGDEEVGLLLGLDPAGGPEAEHPDVLLWVGPEVPDEGAIHGWAPPSALLAELPDPLGEANTLSRGHRRWEAIDQVAEACRRIGGAPPAFLDLRPRLEPPELPVRSVPARPVFRSRRSAVAMDGQTGLPRESFERLLHRLLPTRSIPWTSLPWRPAVHLVLLVHRVHGLEPGIYLLGRDPDRDLRAALGEDLAWVELPGELPLVRLAAGDVQRLAQVACCRQDIASQGAFAVAMLAELGPALEAFGSWAYRHLLWEAGALGQVLYLEAEAAGLRGTGIGCFFDDLVHRVLGIADLRLQMVYGFTVGGPVDDPRLSTEPAYGC